MTSPSLSRHAFARGALDIIPLSLATAPWGLLAGSMAIEAGLSAAQGQAMSLIVFAGAAQLVGIGMLKGGAGFLSIMLTTLLLTSQHLLYSMSMRPTISPLRARWRMPLGFLLTDEFYALCHQQQGHLFNRWYALGVGLTFYVAWNLFTLAGILLGKAIPGLEHLGLEFSIAATFIAIVVPMIRSLAVALCVATALLASVLLHYWEVPSALVIAGLLGMLVGYLCLQLHGEPS